MAASSTEPPPKHVKLRYRALAYVRRIGRYRQPARPRATSRRSCADTGGARPQRRFSDSGGPRPVVRIASKKGFTDSGGVRPVVRIGSRRSFADSTGTPGEIKVDTRSRARKKSRKTRWKRRHWFLASLRDHGGHHFRLFCGCCVEQEAFDPGETPLFHWGVGFDDSYYDTPSNQRLSSGTRFRLELCGLHVTSRNKEPAGLSVDRSSVSARAASVDSGFGFTCASPVACPPPLGLSTTRTLPTALQLRSRDGTGSGKFTLYSGNRGFSSTGFKRKAPSTSSGYPSYTPTTPPSPFMNDFTPADTFNSTRARSRVSVGCNGWYLNDDDPAIVGWYRRRSSGEVKPTPILTHLSQVAEVSRESDAAFDREAPKRYKRDPRVSLAAVVTSPKPPLAPLPSSRASSPATARVSFVILSQDGSVSSSSGEPGWLANSEIAMVPLPTSPPPPSTTSTSRDSYSSGLEWQGESSTIAEPPTKRRRSTGSSSDSNGGFRFENMSTEEAESVYTDTSLSASLRLTRSHSPRTMKRALLPGSRPRKGRRSRSHSASPSRSRRLFHLGFRTKSPVRMEPSPSIVFIDCPP